jgi:hypothetical protein
LWHSIVDLMERHEGAYLHYCRSNVPTRFSRATLNLKSRP